MGLISSIFNVLRFNRRNWRAVLLCIVAATVFWFFNALNKSYSANLNFPLTFEYDEETYVPVSPLPQTVRLNVSGLGWDLFRRSLGVKVPALKIPLENPSDVRKIVGSTLPGYFSSQLEGLQINYVLTDTLLLQIDQRVKRDIALSIPQVETYVRNGFMLSSEVVIQPTRVRLEGPGVVVRKLPDTLALSLPSRNLDSPFSDDVEVVIEGDQVTVAPPVVRISFSVDREVIVNDTVMLHIINIPKEIRSSIIMDEVKCTYALPSGIGDSFDRNTILAEIDLTGLQKGRNRLVPKVTGLPDYARLIRIDTVDVSF